MALPLPLALVLALVLALTLSMAGTATAADPSAIVRTEHPIDGEVEDMLWIGASKQVVILLTDTGRVYRSSNEGLTWVDQTETLRRVLNQDHANADLEVTALIPHDLKADTIFFMGRSHVHWVTHNGGASYTAMENREYPFHEVKFHPLDTHKLLAATLSEKCTNAAAAGNCYKNLFYSSNSGKSWRFLHHYIVQYDWGHKLGAHVPHTMARDAIFFTEYNNKFVDQRFGTWDRDIDFYITHNLFKTVKKLVPRGNRFLFTSKYMFIAQVHERFDNQVNLVITRDGGATFHEADLPFQVCVCVCVGFSLFVCV